MTNNNEKNGKGVNMNLIYSLNTKRHRTTLKKTQRKERRDTKKQKQGLMIIVRVQVSKEKITNSYT